MKDDTAANAPHRLEIKSTAVLLDELITTSLKHHYRTAVGNCGPVELADLAARKISLGRIIDQRLSPGASAGSGLSSLLQELVGTLLACWHAQETVLQSDDTETVAGAARAAQELNAQRNRLMRAIDTLLGEEEITVTNKTYDR